MLGACARPDSAARLSIATVRGIRMQKPMFVLGGLVLGVVIATLASAQNVTAPRPPQTIIIEPIDATHVRLRLQGRENWTVESGAFTIQPTSDSVSLIAHQGGNRVNDRTVETFTLTIGPAGRLGFEMSDARQQAP
jgi:hypothetical protein